MELKIDLEQIKSLSSESANFGKEMIDLYLSQTKTQLEKIEKARKEKDYFSVGRVAHTMKASFAIINCDVLTKLSSDIEEECKNDHPNGTLLDTFIDQFNPLVARSFDLIVEVGKQENLI